MKRSAAFFLLALAACGPTPEQIRANDGARCIGYGFGRETPQFAQCMFLLDQQRGANAAAANAQLLGLGMLLNQQSQPHTLQQPGFNCWTSGNLTRCQ